ncbi:hypothetical protein EVAR_99674_1 [Eumeta japonica]|uniref:DUF5641 domain-containing protein n=1 Tax=Eumeta variegata TaxID=151549 RepID=A0A4C2A5M6_EUMVA|nr:hypothetical protein EVAR_99674_1 [Eumeta japonica]
MALKRMIARRGCPTEIWSDNGTNLRGAARELHNIFNENMKTEANLKTIRWRFIPPGAPFMGGAWERPLTCTTTDPEAPESLTPNHFLLAVLLLLRQALQRVRLEQRAQWRVSQQLADMFWSRWLREYLPELQHGGSRTVAAKH